MLTMSNQENELTTEQQVSSPNDEDTTRSFIGQSEDGSQLFSTG